jgi:hypothetical protein
MGENDDDDMRMFSSKTKEGRVCYNVTCVFGTTLEKDVHKSGLLMKNEACAQRGV